MLDDGLYFDLDEQTYHDDPALGSGDHKDLLLNPIQWQFKRLTALREDLGMGEADKDDTAAQAFGTLAHIIAMFGREVFDLSYVAAPQQPAGLLTDRQSIREALGARCTLPASATLYDLTAEAKRFGVGPLGTDWAFERSQIIAGRQEISKRWGSTLYLIDRMLDFKRPKLGGLSTREKFLKGGYAEVSLFWTDAETGVRYKARFDYLKIKAILDLKTYAAREGENSVGAFCRAIHTYAYDVQAAHYLEGRAAIPALVAAGRVFGQHDPAWLKRLADNTAAQTWSWLTIRTTGFPEVDVMEFQASTVLSSARYQLAEARRAYIENRDRYGLDEPWVADRGIIVLGDESMNSNITARGDVRWTEL